MKRPTFLKRTFGRIARAVLWCFGFNIHGRRTYTCDGCGGTERKRAQPVAMPRRVLLFCPACVKKGKVEKARKLQRDHGLSRTFERAFKELVINKLPADAARLAGKVVLARHPKKKRRKAGKMNAFRKAFGERG